MPRQKEFDREEVLHKAMIAFRDKGYEATSMQDLVDSMEINRFSLYETFSVDWRIPKKVLKSLNRF